MTYSNIPHLNGTFDSPIGYFARRIATTFVEGHAEDYSRDGFNTIRHKRTISEYIPNLTQRNDLDAFLKERNGKPFLYAPFLDTSTSGTLYRCSEWNFQKVNDASLTGDRDMYLFTATFEQVFRP